MVMRVVVTGFDRTVVGLVNSDEVTTGAVVMGAVATRGEVVTTGDVVSETVLTVGDVTRGAVVSVLVPLDVPARLLVSGGAVNVLVVASGALTLDAVVDAVPADADAVRLLKLAAVKTGVDENRLGDTEASVTGATLAAPTKLT